MKNILFITSSLNGHQGQSTMLGETLVSNLAANKNANVIQRDLAADDLPHLSQSEIGAWMAEPNERTEEQVALAKASDNLVEELKNSDTIVIGMPMYNFGVPSTFKTWVDRVARAGVTFRYTENGPEGLLENKKAIIVAARGGIYAGTEHDSQTQYLKDFLAFIGIKDVSFVYAEGLNMPGSETRLAAAQKELTEITL
ncbi:FMN-dependent NADH-azoreductase [Psychromonas sp. GE-S-Ul-11]|uniref:FMN-dependent NADH-azoreductase n=1 Tax=Psychromonas sp. GE-S-Ul-11 TaxID=3241170 RepID=UPI00390CB7BC